MWMSRMCGVAANADDDCVMLARLAVPIIWVGGSPAGGWQVSGGSATIIVDESRRPYLTNMRLLQEWLLCSSASENPVAPTVLPQDLAPTSSPSFAGLTTTGAMQIAIMTVTADLTLDATHHCVVCANALTLTLPKCVAANRGRVYILKSPNAAPTVACDPTDSIDGAGTTTAIAAGNALTLVSDGSNTWHIISALA